MICPYCGEKVVKAGFDYNARGKVQRWECKKCHRHTVKPKEEKGDK
jgi:transposase-like protein